MNTMPDNYALFFITVILDSRLRGNDAFREEF
jgi:hypothetical protein